MLKKFVFNEEYAKRILELKNIDLKHTNIEDVLNILQSSHDKVYKSVAFDVDGTLTKKNSTKIDEEMSKIIADLLKKGVHVLLISGRGRGSMRDAVSQIIMKSEISLAYLSRLSCIAHNGIYWLKTSSKKDLNILNFEEILVPKPLTLIKELRLDISENKVFVPYFRSGKIKITEEPSKKPYLLRIIYDKELYNQDKSLYILFCETLKVSIKTIYKGEAKDVFLTQAIHSGNYLFNISNTNKTNALNYYAKRLGINPKSILRVGDQGHYLGNDYELLDTESGFSVGTISNELDRCLPVISDNCKTQLLGVSATRTLLNRVKLFPPLSLEPQYQSEQLLSLQEFEELASKRSKVESGVFTEKLKLRLHRLFYDKDSSFDSKLFRLSDLFDLHSGAVSIKSYEVVKLHKDNFLRKIFNLDDTIFFNRKPPNLKWSMFSDTNILLRGANYYWAITNKQKIETNNNYFKFYFDDCISFVNEVINSINDLKNTPLNFIIYKLFIGIMDNIRNILINFLYATYKVEFFSENKDYRQTKNIYKLLKDHTILFFDILLEENISWVSTVNNYYNFLINLPKELKKTDSIISDNESNKDKNLIRNWRESDFFFENLIAINLGIHEFSEQLEIKQNKRKNEELICLGLAYGGIELPVIAEVLADKKNINLKGGILQISLYSNKEIREHNLSNNPLADIEYYTNTLESYLEFSEFKLEFNKKKIILLDDNCTTCRTLEITRNVLINEGAEVVGAIVVRHPSTNRYAQMLFPKHGLPDPDILLSFVRGFISPSPYSRIFSMKEEKGMEYLDRSGIFDKAKSRILRYLEKNSCS